MIRDQLTLDLNKELIVYLFAGGGGGAVAIERALGRHVDIAANHAKDATAMHRMNHPQAKHFVQDVFDVDPREVTRGRQVGILHISPDCTDHSQSKAGQPRSRAIRSLTWVGLYWAGTVRPRVLTLENVKQIENWGPLVCKRCKKTKLRVKHDGSLAADGEVIPLENQWLVPDRKNLGRNWQRFIRRLREMGYAVEWRVDRAANFGAPTIRQRLYMVARCDGQPIVWPAHSHAKIEAPTLSLKKWREAAEHIDFSLPCPSIFGRKRPLVKSTLERIADGVVEEVLEHADPFIVPVSHSGERPIHKIHEPARTITGANRGELAFVAPTFVECAHGEVGKDGAKRWGKGHRGVRQPLGTISTSNNAALVTAFMAQMNGGNNTTAGHSLTQPLSTIQTKGSQQQLITAHLAHFRQNCAGRSVRDPLQTISAGGEHHGLVQCTLSPDHEAYALRTAAFLMRYYKNDRGSRSLRNPAATITTLDRLALVTVIICGIPLVLIDIGLRMLTPRELFLLQGFPSNYIIDRGREEDGTIIPLNRGQQVRMCGNSISPPHYGAIVAANCMDMAAWFKGEREAVSA